MPMVSWEAAVAALPDELRQVADNLCGFVRLRSHVEKPVFLSVYIVWGGTVDYRFLTEDSAEEFFRVPAKMMPLDVTFEQEIQLAKWLFSQYGLPYDKVGALLCRNPRANGARAFPMLADKLAVRRDEDAASAVLPNVMEFCNA